MPTGKCAFFQFIFCEDRTFMPEVKISKFSTYTYAYCILTYIFILTWYLSKTSNFIEHKMFYKTYGRGHQSHKLDNEILMTESIAKNSDNNLLLLYLVGRMFANGPGRPVFNPLSNHTKDSKNSS